MARSKRAGRLRETIAQLCAEHAAVVRLTEGPGDAEAQAERAVAQGFRTVVAAGGDGTVNEVVNGLAGSSVTLGLLPLGTMNVFAAELGVPGNEPRKCWDIIEAGHVRRIDLARANDHYFVQLAGIGFDAQAVEGVDQGFKNNFGPLSYVISAARVAARRPPRLIVETEHAPAREGCFVLVGNGRFYGGKFEVFKNATLDDGKLDVIICKNVGHLDLIRYVQNVLFGTHLELPDVEHFQARKLVVRPAEENERVPFEADGELVGHAPVTFRVTPGRLRVLTPRPKVAGARPVRLSGRAALAAAAAADAARRPTGGGDPLLAVF
ncbi:MAG: diacylglycerol kinase family lipid kinase [Verrucomicrobia bacterium]|nr:diacylglycerol kinase family lipid kinase [Verrucomicrobiota bacterium]